LSFFAACLVAGLALVYRAPAPLHGQAPNPPDVIYYNAKVVTVDERSSVAQAVAIKGDKFVAVGSNQDVRKLATPATRQIDLRGLTVVPGLTDNHLHTRGGPGVDPRGRDRSATC
jgi:imidazolonepropionase-like amidohydrolase